MVCGYKTSKHLDKVLFKLQKKDNKLYINLFKKINEIINSPNIEHYKNLKYNMKEFKAAHVGSFVLIFRFNKINNLVYFTDFDHHDNVYK